MSDLRFLIDENAPHSIGDQLRLRQPDLIVQNVGDGQAPPLGTPDPDLLLWMEREGVCLVTRNRSSLPRHLRDHLASGHHAPAIFTLRSGASLIDVIDDLLLIYAAAKPDEYQDQIAYVPL